MKTRMPFQYGIASLTSLPHLIVHAHAQIDGVSQIGLSSEGLPPKWFTKNPQTHFNDDLPELIEVIEAACRHMVSAGECESPFKLWKLTFDAQREWADSKGYPPLLWAFGVSLAERAMIDAFCKAKHIPFVQALHQNLFGIDLSVIHPELAGTAPSQWLPHTPATRLTVRHTVGLGDPVREADITDANRINDGLPQSLESCIQTYGINHFKIKICGDKEKDLDRLHRLADLFQSLDLDEYAFTLDGNEQFRDVDAFRSFWQLANSDNGLSNFFSHLLFVEQPLHRDVALSEQAASQQLAWKDRPPTIIDESDGDTDSLRLALNNGYIGTSHKNCKGIFKGIANACYIQHLNVNAENQPYQISGEDLANVGPVALLQDLVLMSALGITHVERNGHHYFKGLSMWPEQLNEDVIMTHADLYEMSSTSFPTMKITNGSIEIKSLLQSPFGCGVALNCSEHIPLKDWAISSL
ncbi:MAG: hypothetical protein P9L94_16490 [Candidatus Hinthialibacter antarcticus]|nr:hypothetical protein [Candidatus Hinthialibacter antarcticus]